MGGQGRGSSGVPQFSAALLWAPPCVPLVEDCADMPVFEDAGFDVCAWAIPAHASAANSVRERSAIFCRIFVSITFSDLIGQ